MIRAIEIGLLAAFISTATLGGPMPPTRGPADLVDINRASVAELLRAPGMTASWAGRIVRFRPYHSKYELVQLGVVTPDVYRRIRDGVVARHIERVEQPGAAKPR